MNFGAAGIGPGVQLNSPGTPAGATLAAVFVELVRKADGNVVLVIDE